MREVMNFLSRVGDVIIDIYGLPVLLGETIWNAVPQCIRDPIVDFLGPIILRQVELFSELVKDDDAWKKTKEEVGRLIKLVFHNKDLVGAIKAAFMFVLRIFNLPPDLLATVAAKAMAAWDQVIRKPLEFIKSTIKAIAQGFKIIWDDKLENIKNGLQGWLLGEIKDKNIIMPTNWTDLGQIFEFVLSILGISVDHVYELLEQRFPGRAQKFRQVMGKITRIMEWVNKSIDVTKSPKDNAAGMLNQAKDFGLSLLESGAEWIIKKVAAKVTEELVKAAATAGFGAILTAAQSLYNALVTAKKWMRQILDMANRGLDNIVDLVNGAFEKVGGVFADLMKKGMPVVIGFLADQVGLGDVGRELGKAIDKLRAKVDKAILWIIDKLKAGIDWLIGLGKKAIEKVAGWLGISERFKTEDNEPHRIYLEGSERNAKIMVASNVISLAKLLEPDGNLESEVKSAGTPRKTTALANARAELAAANKAKLTLEKTPEDADSIKTLRASFRKLVVHLAILGVGVSKEFPEAKFSYQPIGPIAGTATVSGLSKNTPEGQKPAPTIVGWTHVKTFDPEHKYWERVHLVSQFFGGSGANANLIPARKTDNAWMREGPEAAVKAMLEKNMIVHYKVAVAGYHDIKDPDDNQAIHGFPTGVKIDISTMKKRGKEWVQDVATKLYPAHPIAAPPPKGKALVDLKTASYKTWRVILGLPSGLSHNISEVKGSGSFANEADFLSRMRAFYRNMKSANKGDFEDYIPEIDRLLGRKSEKARAYF
ncbi:hypothetical protein N0Q91_18945 [Sinorhizobium sp. K101]|uniref:hypothetical protein n=1 Tax=Sinorhizobium sp. K101 TaxID=2976820 RepID=UPI0023D86443|nr:hypothetical protein [Sinorhizobium sp. K101]WEJ15498.1 hypothetical protein N0Q91_18945 [Sinorhizobium sp. K101]